MKRAYTPEYEAHLVRVRALLEARENPSERFNMPTAWESRLNIWRNNIETFEGHRFEDAIIELITNTPLPTAPMHELAVSDLLGMYMMGEEL